MVWNCNHVYSIHIKYMLYLYIYIYIPLTSPFSPSLSFPMFLHMHMLARHWLRVWRVGEAEQIPSTRLLELVVRLMKSQRL